MMAPIVGAIGERPTIVVLSRLVMVPLVLISVALAWRIGVGLYSKRAALWAAAATLLIPDFALGSVEYRTDQLWTVAWMATLAVICLGHATMRRVFLAGVLLGICFCVSMKTSILITSFALGCGTAAFLARRRGLSLGAGRLTFLAAAGGAGALVVPALMIIYFASKGALSGLWYGAVEHNIVPSLGSWGHTSARVLLLPLSLPILLWIGRSVTTGAPDPSLGVRRGALFLGAGLYYVSIVAVWPLVTRQDFLPLIPMAAVAVTPYLVSVAEWAESRRTLTPLYRACRYAPSLALILTAAKTQAIEPAWRDNDVGVHEAFVEEVLRMTRPQDLVMDVKGETIFRARPCYYAFEPVTNARIESGALRDSIAERLVETRTPIAVQDSPEFPEKGRSFLIGNYVSAGSLRYAGAELDPPDRQGVRRFTIHVPQRYELVSDRGPVGGSLDGSPFDGARELAAGSHVFQGVPKEGMIDAVWAEAIARGTSPFPANTRHRIRTR
ncbi:MAG: hypothetical protein ACRENN_10055 [Candidatus Eiseniibacteriota bacterium]